MRSALGVMTLLAGCGEVAAIKTDAPVAIDAAADATPDAPPIVPRLYALTSAFGQGATLYGLEIIDLRDMSKIQRFALGAGNAMSLQVSPDGHTAYVADMAAAQVSFVNTSNGMADPNVSLASVRDLALSADGKKLFAAAGDKVVAIDTATQATTPSPSLGANQIALGLTLSPNGQRIAASSTNGGSASTIALIRTSDMSIEAQVPITTDVANCLAQPFNIAFSDNALLVSWDSNCDELYQVDVGTHAQLTTKNIATGRDSGSGGFVTSRIAVSAMSHLVYAVKEDGNVMIMNPQTLTFTAAGGYSGTPFAVATSPNGDKLHVVVNHGASANTLDIMDTATSGFQRDAYTFSVANQSTIDMAIVAAP